MTRAELIFPALDQSRFQDEIAVPGQRGVAVLDAEKQGISRLGFTQRPVDVRQLAEELCLSTTFHELARVVIPNTEQGLLSFGIAPAQVDPVSQRQHEWS